MKRTIQQVAERAGVGVGTVSRVLNNHPSVRPETRDRVITAMTEMGYIPNPHARRVAGGKSYTVSIMLPVVSTEFYIRLLNGLERTLESHRYDSALFPLLSRERLERYLNSNTLIYQADGIVMATHNLGELYGDGKLPTRQAVVVVDGASPHYDSVFLDNQQGGRIAGERFAGFEGPIFALSSRNELDEIFTSTVLEERLEGFSRALEVAGRSLPKERVYRVGFNLDAARAAAREILDAHRTPVNVFATADFLALGVLEEAERRNLELGKDVRVIGFDDQPWTLERGLSTIHQPVEAMGAAASELLVDRLGGYSGAARQVRFEPRLVERRSTDAGAELD
jgi:DNA-binding LacI/PurR family transcriptional regulator